MSYEDSAVGAVVVFPVLVVVAGRAEAFPVGPLELDLREPAAPIDTLAQRPHPLRAQIEVMHIFTPDDFESELNATWGNAFAIEPKFTQTAWFRPHNRSEDVEGLYLVGGGTHPGAGIPGVLSSAKVVENVLKREDWT